jgi:hypothetical protein
MDRTRRVPRLAAVAAVVVGLAAGSYGVAAAASGTSSSSTASSPTSSTTTPAATNPSAPPAQQGWGQRRSDETLLTGDTASKVKAAALAKVPGATIARVETDADGHAAYEAHMVKSDGTLVTVYVDKQFNVVSVESR